MNKGLDLIARQQPEFINDFPTGNISIGVTKEELTELENELKALKIIKEKQVDVRMFIIYDLENYNKLQKNDYCKLTKTEDDLLKEALL